MMNWLGEYGLFMAKWASVAVLALVFVAATRKLKTAPREGELKITRLNERYDDMAEALQAELLDPAALKAHRKARKKAAKQKNKTQKQALKTADHKPEKRIFVIDFDGDIQASAVEALREEISAILTLAEKSDEVLLRLESGGGVVHGYGLAASQLQRLRAHKVRLTVAVDKVAASGGYLMACVADKIIAAPFAFIGSIGVLMQLPNLHRLLEHNKIDFEQLYAGEYKRTLTLFGENTDAARAKKQEELEEVHDQFKQFVSLSRPKLDINQVATGECWLGQRAAELGLVDELQTSDDYLMAARDKARLVQVTYRTPRSMLERLSERFNARALTEFFNR